MKLKQPRCGGDEQQRRTPCGHWRAQKSRDTTKNHIQSVKAQRVEHCSSSKHKHFSICTSTALFLILSLVAFAHLFAQHHSVAAAPSPPSTLHEFTILTTNDLHSHFEGNGPLHHKDTKGHFARVAYLIRHIQSIQPKNTITLDAGDFFCGTLFSMLSISYLFPSLLPELQFLKYLKVDATTIGNHEAIHHEAEFGMMMKKYWDGIEREYFYGVPWEDMEGFLEEQQVDEKELHEEGACSRENDSREQSTTSTSVHVTVLKEENQTTLSKNQQDSDSDSGTFDIHVLADNDLGSGKAAGQILRAPQSSHVPTLQTHIWSNYLTKSSRHAETSLQHRISSQTQTFSIPTIPSKQFSPSYDHTRGVLLKGAVPILRSNIEFIDKCQHLNSFHAGAGPPSQDNPEDYSWPTQSHNSGNLNLFPWFVLRKVESAPNPLTGARQVPLRVGIFSSYGVDASDISQPTRGGCMKTVGFNDQTRKKEWQNYVAHIYHQARILREKHEAEFVILIAHEGEPYNTRLVKALTKMAKKDASSSASPPPPVINVLVSSHTHKIYSKQVDGVHIIQAGANGENIGVLRVQFNSQSGESKMINPSSASLSEPLNLQHATLRDFPQITPVHSSIPLDQNVHYMIEHYKHIIDKYFLKETEFKYSDYLGAINTQQWQGKSDLMRYIANCVHSQVDQMLTEKGEELLDVYFLGSSLVRASPEDTVFTGNLTFSDVQRILGYGSMTAALNSDTLQATFGDPITHFYLTVQDFKAVEQARKIAAWYKQKYFFQTSSNRLKTVTRRWGIPFVNRIKDIVVNGDSLNRSNKKLVHVAISHTALHFFKRFKEYSLGVVDPIVRDKYGRESQEQLLYQQEYMLLAQCVKEGSQKHHQL